MRLPARLANMLLSALSQTIDITAVFDTLSSVDRLMAPGGASVGSRPGYNCGGLPEAVPLG